MEHYQELKKTNRLEEVMRKLRRQYGDTRLTILNPDDTLPPTLREGGIEVEIATHPNDLYIECGAIKGKPGKFLLNICRGEGHRYKPLITSDDPRSWADSKEEQLEVLRKILLVCALQAIYHGYAPATYKAFQKLVQSAGFTTEWISDEHLLDVYSKWSETGPIPIFTALIDPESCLNATMITEIMERFKTSDTVDTSREPLKSFPASTPV